MTFYEILGLEGFRDLQEVKTSRRLHIGTFWIFHFIYYSKRLRLG